MRFALALAALTFTTTALAQTPGARPMVSPECRAEVVKLCPASDRAARRECMMTNRDKLSAGCKKELLALRDMRQGGRVGGNGDMAAPGAMTTEPKPQ